MKKDYFHHHLETIAGVRNVTLKKCQNQFLQGVHPPKRKGVFSWEVFPCPVKIEWKWKWKLINPYLLT